MNYFCKTVRSFWDNADILLSLSGYVSTDKATFVQQSGGTIRNIYNMATFVPGIAYLLVALLFAAYPLNKRKVAETSVTLKERRKNG